MKKNLYILMEIATRELEANLILGEQGQEL